MRALAAALLVLAAPAWAAAQDLAEATKGWDSDAVPATAWEAVEFADENGGGQKLYYKAADLGLDKTSLFALDPEAAVEKLEMAGGTAEVAAFKKNKLSVYALKASPAGSLMSPRGEVIRLDKPDLVIPVSLGRWEFDRPFDFSAIRLNDPDKKPKDAPVLVNTAAWYRAPGLFTAPADGKWTTGALGRLKARVSVPAGIDAGKASPMTGVLEEKVCVGFDASLQKSEEAVPLTTQVFRAFIPTELEFQIAALHANVATPALLSSSGFAEAVSGLSEGKSGKARDFVSETRTTLRRVASRKAMHLKSLQRTGESAGLLTPFESRFLTCRMRHLGDSSAKDFRSKLRKLDKTPEDKRAKAIEAFVADWRGFVLAELEAYQKESQGLPELPDLPDHAALDKALHARSQAGPSASAADLAKPKLSPKKLKKASEDAGAWAESLVQ